MDKNLLSIEYLEKFKFEKTTFKNITSYKLLEYCFLEVNVRKSNTVFKLEVSPRDAKSRLIETPSCIYLPKDYTIKEFENLCKGLRINLKVQHITQPTVKTSPGHYGC